SSAAVPTSVWYSTLQRSDVSGTRRSNAPVAGSIVPRKPAVPVVEFRKSTVVPRCWMATTTSREIPTKLSTRCSFHSPVRSTQGAPGPPPPQTPAVHCCPVVQGEPSSHAAPSGSGVHTDGIPVQAKHGSTRQLASQPSPFVGLP